MAELARQIHEAGAQSGIGSVVLTGGPHVFAAGADIASLASSSFAELYQADFISRDWDPVAACPKPMIAAVAGYALGGGCELALMCDLIFAAPDAQFAQPELGLGIMPGAGGTQRLARFIGKAKAMDLCLTGRRMRADEAERCGLISRIVPHERLLEEALEVAQSLAEKSQPAARMVKEAVNYAYEAPLAAGLAYERRLFYASFALEDQKEGMQAFLEKRPPRFKDS